MYVLIDKARMCFCFRHANVNTVLQLAHLELGENAAHAIEETDATETGWGGLTTFEMRQLYNNTVECPIDATINRPTLEKAISDVVLKLPVADVIEGEVEIQASTILASDTDSYRYIKGSKKPRIRPDENPLPILKAGNVVIKATKAEPAAPMRQTTKPTLVGGVKQHIRNMFAEASKHTLEALTADGKFGIASIKTALSDLKNEKYAGGEILVTSRVKVDGVDHYVKE